VGLCSRPQPGEITDSGMRQEVDMRGRGRVGDLEVDVLDGLDGP